MPAERIWRAFCGLAALGVTLCSVASARADDFGTWQGLSLRVVDTRHVDLVATAEARFYQDSRELLQYRLTPRLVVDANRYLRATLGYTYLPTRSSDSDEFIDQHRMELEVTPRWPVTDRLTLDLRNRLEIRWIEGRSGANERLRHRLGASYRIRDTGLFRSVFAGDEVFFDFDRGDVTQNRLTPLGLRFRLSEHVGFNVYYMLQSQQARGKWSHAHVLGTHLALSL